MDLKVEDGALDALLGDNRGNVIDDICTRKRYSTSVDALLLRLHGALHYRGTANCKASLAATHTSNKGQTAPYTQKRPSQTNMGHATRCLGYTKQRATITEGVERERAHLDDMHALHANRPVVNYWCGREAKRAKRKPLNPWHPAQWRGVGSFVRRY